MDDDEREQRPALDIFTDWFACILSFAAHIGEAYLLIHIWETWKVPPSQALTIALAPYVLRAFWFMIRINEFAPSNFWDLVMMGLFNIIYMPMYTYLLYKSTLLPTLTMIFMHGPLWMSLGMAFVREYFFTYLCFFLLSQVSLFFLLQPELYSGLPEELFGGDWNVFKHPLMNVYVFHCGIAASWALSCYYFSVLRNAGKRREMEIVFVTSSIMGCYLTKSFSNRPWIWDPILELDKSFGIWMGILFLVAVTRGICPLLTNSANPHKALGTYTLVIPSAFAIEIFLTKIKLPNLMTIIAASTTLVLGIVMGVIRNFTKEHKDRMTFLSTFLAPAHVKARTRKLEKKGKKSLEGTVLEPLI